MFLHGNVQIHYSLQNAPLHQVLHSPVQPHTYLLGDGIVERSASNEIVVKTPSGGRRRYKLDKFTYLLHLLKDIQLH